MESELTDEQHWEHEMVDDDASLDALYEGPWFIHKYEESQAYGGPEEGGWYYDLRTPVTTWVPIQTNSEDAAYELCRTFNEQEFKRREHLRYGYTSVLSYREEFYVFLPSSSVTPDESTPRPRYE